MKALKHPQIEEQEGQTTLSVQDYVTYCQVMAKLGECPPEALAKVEASYPLDYDGDVCAISVSTESFNRAFDRWAADDYWEAVKQVTTPGPEV